MVQVDAGRRVHADMGESAVMLAATSKQVRGLLVRMQRRLPAAVRVRSRASMESVASGLPRLLAWAAW